METHTIYRVENVLGLHKGKGPHRGEPVPGDPGWSREREIWDATVGDIDVWSETRPTPDMDYMGNGGHLYIFDHEVCGFADPAQLLSWFPEDTLRRLTSTGFYRLFRFECPADLARFGRYQAVFVRAACPPPTPVEIDDLIREHELASGRTTTLSEPVTS